MSWRVIHIIIITIKTYHTEKQNIHFFQILRRDRFLRNNDYVFLWFFCLFVFLCQPETSQAKVNYCVYNPTLYKTKSIRPFLCLPVSPFPPSLTEPATVQALLAVSKHKRDFFQGFLCSHKAGLK